MKKYIILYTILICSAHTVYAGETLSEDIADGYLDNHRKIEAAFILSGVEHPDSLQRYLEWYDRLFEEVRNLPLDHSDRVESARIVFLYLHSAWLKTYALESTTLIDIARSKEYNCVAATILYNIVCEDLGWSSRAFETPNHVYTIFENFGQDLIVENTSTMGFDIMKNLKAYSKYLTQYYPQSQALHIGLDRLYYHENSKGRTITNTELLGLLAYNRAYLARKNNDFKEAYDLILVAQQFNSDSRSNIRFETSLYYAWGIELFEKKRFTEAFAVFADGFYRYPDNEGLLKNTFSSFYNALQTHWQEKNWSETRRLIREMQALEILKEKDRARLNTFLQNWLQYSNLNKNRDTSKEITRLMDMLMP